MLWKGVKAIMQSGGRKDSARIRRQSVRNRRALEHMHSSEAFTRGGLGTEARLDALGYFDRGFYGVPLPAVNGQPVWDNTDKSIHVTGLPGSPKTTAIGLPIAATWPGSCLIVDVGHEYARATWQLRSVFSDVYFVTPRGKYGFRSSNWNPFSPIVDAIASDKEHALGLAKDVSFTLVQQRSEGRTGDNDWVDIAARELIVMALLYLAKERPQQCTPAGLYSFLMQPVAAVIKTVGTDANLTPVMRRLLRLQAEFAAKAFKQIEWKFQKSTESLSAFEPETAYARITNRNDFDPAQAKSGRRPMTIYLGFDSNELESGGVFTSLYVSMCIERIANASGDIKTLILADEFAAAPKIVGLLKAVRSNRKDNIKVITLGQTRQSIAQRWGKAVQEDIENMAGTLIWLTPEYQVAKELEAKSGTKTVISHGGRDSEQAHFGKSISESKAPNLHASEAFYLPNDQAILEIKGMDGLVIADLVPWWEIHPLSKLIDPGYRDDNYQYKGS